LGNKNVIITGGTGGIGRILCKRFLESGYNVSFIYHNNSKMAYELEKLSSDKLTIRGFQCDVSIIEQVENVFAKIIGIYGNVDVLVNNAGASMDSLLMNMTSSMWDKSIFLNLNSVFYCTRQIVPLMMEQQSGSIINISSIMGSIGWAGLSHYSAAKAGVEAFTRSASVELGRFNIRVNSIAPGMLDTEMSRDARNKMGEKVKKLTPLRTYGTPDDVSELILFLASDKAKFITGENYFIRGGLGSGLSIS
jgi:3-oxoacyl-[acyl-carrier protein] reductase